MSDAPAKTDPLSDGWVLVVASEARARAAEALLSKGGCSLNTAHSPEEALEFVDAVVFDLILLSLDPQPERVLDFVRKLRHVERKRPRRAPVIGLTGQPSPELRRRCLSAGADDMLAEPLDTARLRRALARLAEASPRGLTAER